MPIEAINGRCVKCGYRLAWVLVRGEHLTRLTQAGDIDNRLKTLLDSLQVPKPDQLGSLMLQQPMRPRFTVLVEDDNLITTLSVTTDRLLTDATSNNEVILLIRVTLEFTHQHFTNLIPPPRLL
jgi:hypothetical protein